MKSNHKSRRLRFAAEKLEPRRLLAADLEVVVEPFDLESPGDEVTRVVRVHNNGDEEAADTLIQSLLSDQLENPTWTRTPGLSEIIVRKPATEALQQTIQGQPGISMQNLSVIGDINGDGSAGLRPAGPMGPQY